MKIHFIFHISLLESYKLFTIPERTHESSLFIIINDKNEWKIEEILDSKLRYRKLWYKIRWTKYFISKNSWQSASDLINTSDLVKQFHIHYSFKSSHYIISKLFFILFLQSTIFISLFTSYFINSYLDLMLEDLVSWGER